jgi:hypothetical protein
MYFATTENTFNYHDFFAALCQYQNWGSSSNPLNPPFLKGRCEKFGISSSPYRSAEPSARAQAESSRSKPSPAQGEGKHIENKKEIPSPLMGEGEGGGDLGDFFTASGGRGGISIYLARVVSSPGKVQVFR